MKEILQLKKEALDVLCNNILPFWLKLMDTERGGFYGRVTGEGVLEKDAPRSAIMNARILWAFSAAYRVLGDATYLQAATHARDYILKHFMDKEYGGTYWVVDCNGEPIDTKKQFYALGFMLYGMSEYAQATGDETALNTAIELFETIERFSLDRVNNGYLEACTRDWQPVMDNRLSGKDVNLPKSQNTHLHILEPYTNLFRIWKDKRLEKALRNLIHIFTSHILNPETYHLDVFFEKDWTRSGHIESCGHDIECSWLLHEAAIVLEDPDILSEILPIIQKVAKASENGIQPDCAIVREANLDTGVTDSQREWWVQAEAVVGYLNIYQHFGDEHSARLALDIWSYIKTHLIDYEHGEWFWSCDAEGHVNRAEDKAGFWKCPYHNSRMCLEIISRTSLS